MSIYNIVFNINHFIILVYKTPKNGENWLFHKIDKSTIQKNNKLQIPEKANGEEYRLEDLNEGQFKIAYVILKKIKNGYILQQQPKKENVNLNHYE